MAQDRDRERRPTRKTSAESGTEYGATGAGDLSSQGTAPTSGSTRAGSRTDDASWSSGASRTSQGDREGGSTGDRESYGRFYSRARNRYSQWEGRGAASNEWGYGGRPSYGQGGYTSGYGLRGPRDVGEQYGSSRGGGYREPSGYGWGYGATGGTGSQYSERGMRGRGMGERGYGERGYERGGGERGWGAMGSERGGYGQGYSGQGFEGTEPGYGGARDLERTRDLPDQDLGRGFYSGGGGVAQRGAPERGTSERGEERRSRWQREPLSAREIMTKNPKSAHPDSSIRDVAQIMKDENTGIVPVVDDNDRLQGVVTDRDIVMRSIPEGKDPNALHARDLMTDDVDAVTPDDSVLHVIHVMGDKQIRRVPVVDQDDRLVGIISMSDIATRADFDTDLQDALEEISSKRSFWSKLFG